MLALRAYRESDAAAVASWLADERVFCWWSAGHLGEYPLAADRLNAFYAPGIAAGDWFPQTLEEDGRPCGQLLMRWKDQSQGLLHFGFIVVDGSQRGKGLGAAMLSMALEHAFHVVGAQCVTLNVFAENAPAIRCYERLGFICAEEFMMEIGAEKHRMLRYEKR